MSDKKVVLVTGSSRGIGRAIAEEYAARGHIVYGGARSTLAENKPAAFTEIKLDINDASSIESAVKKILQEQNRIDILVNNAGISHCGSLEETSLDYARLVFETNYFGLLKLVQTVLPQMRERKSGAIVNIGSAAGKIAIPFQGHYAASKFALEGLSESLWHELAPFGIRVLLIEPGDVETGIWERTKQPVPAGSPYTELLAGFLKVKEKEMGGQATAPREVAKQIIDIAESDTRTLRHPVAKMAGVFLGLRKILPDNLFMRAVGKNYGFPFFSRKKQR